MRTVADVVTGNCGEYCFKAQAGKYCVYLKQDWRDEYHVGDITVYDDSKPGTLNDFLTALDEGDLKPDVVKLFEEMVAQVQQSAKATATARSDAERFAGEAENSAQTSGTSRDESVDAAERARLYHNAASSAATSAENAANAALGHENSAAEYARQAKASQDAGADNAGSEQ